MIRVAVDAMGGDFAPSIAVRGALRAAREHPSVEVCLVGDEARIRAELPDESLPPRISIEAATDVLEMHENPVETLRKKPDSSIARGVAMLAEGTADALVSAGNTGGVVAAASLGLDRLEGVRRAGIAAPFPTQRGHCVLMDVGANLQTRAADLVDYAVMAAEYARAVLEIENPTVGVLSVGGEQGKGSPLVRKAAEALEATDVVTFAGNVEGQDIFAGDVDVVVCEGFVGNVILKSSEGLFEAFVHHMLQRIERDLEKTGEVSRQTVLANALEDLRQRTDYTRYGGAPLMGHRGAIVICHGRSPAAAISAAVGVAAQYVKRGVNERIAKDLATLRSEERVAAALDG